MRDGRNRWLTNPISPESRLLLLCARLEVNEAARERIGVILNSGLDWKKLEELCHRHRVLPLVYRTLVGAFPQNIPGTIRNRLADAMALSEEHNHINLRVLLEILSDFDTHDIRVIPFKGVTLALSVYGDIGVRQCGDIDLLVKPDDFLRAKDLLVRKGFHHLYFGHAEVSTAQAQLGASDGRPSVDLHYNVTPLFQHTDLNEARVGEELNNRSRNQLVKRSTYWFYSFGIDCLWDSLTNITVADRKMHVFSPEYNLLISCAHGCKENWRMLRRVCDVAEILRRHENLDWDALISRVDSLGCRNKFQLALATAHEYLGAPLPTEMLQFVERSARLTWLSRRYVAVNYAVGGWTWKDQGGLWHAANFLTMDTIRDSIRYLVYVFRGAAPDDQRRLRLLGFRGYLVALIREMSGIVLCRLGYGAKWRGFF